VSNLPVRLALVGSASNIAAKSKMLERLRDVIVSVKADSMEAALRNRSDFQATVVDCLEDAYRAAESGKHVFIDASIATSFQQAETLIQSCQQQAVMLFVGGLPRHTPACLTIVDRLWRGQLGEPGFLRVHRWCAQSTRSSPPVIYGDIDLALHLFRALPTEIYAIGRDQHAYLQVHLGFARGGMALLDFAQQLPKGQGYNSLSLIGSKGAAYADDHQNTQLIFAGGNPAALISDLGVGALHELREFARCIASNVTPSVDGHSILAAHRVTDAIHHSVETRAVLHQRGGMYEPA
jgi:predicted dehydrogenase